MSARAACRKHGRWRSSRAEISVVVAFSVAHLEIQIPIICKRNILSRCAILHHHHAIRSKVCVVVAVVVVVVVIVISSERGSLA